MPPNDPSQPRRRSRVPPPGFVMGETSYDRAGERKELERAVDEFKREEEHAVKIRITAGAVSMDAELNDSATARNLLAALPIASAAKTWGKEVYFQIPMHADPEDPQPDAPAGTVAFWPDGDCLCIFFGQKPYSPVNFVGRLLGDPKAFAKVAPGDAVRVEKLD